MKVRRSGNSAEEHRAGEERRLLGYRLAVVVAGLALFSIVCTTLVLAAPRSRSAGDISVNPGRAYNGDPIEKSLRDSRPAILPQHAAERPIAKLQKALSEPT